MGDIMARNPESDYQKGLREGREQGVNRIRTAWRDWYESLPENLRSQIDAHQVEVKAERAA